MFTITNHLLGGSGPQGLPVKSTPSANHGGVIVPRYLVFHYTACTAEAARSVFLRQGGTNPVSVQLLVDRDGSVTQFVPFNLRAWHAGTSSWDGVQDLNSHSIGIEVVNFGYLLQSADGSFRTADGTRQVPQAEVIAARHKLPQWPWQHWHAYTPEQIATCEALTEAIAQAYPLRDVVGHEDIAPARKADPGPAFPLMHLAGLALGRDAAVVTQESRYVAVDKLNLRGDPSTGQPPVGAPLVRNARLSVLGRDPGGWVRVRTAQAPTRDGWVWAAYTAAAPA